MFIGTFLLLVLLSFSNEMVGLPSLLRNFACAPDLESQLCVISCPPFDDDHHHHVTKTKQVVGCSYFICAFDCYGFVD